ncbi:MAG TPA: DEAD/DEAH box helicase [Candidatus Saccharimonadales bacterium]|jgi:superfamily II DNA/RNA helicase|nr:DEAD/DEAH box helicase [Candidatus Saccharimonadales bacterium]
MSKYLYRQQTAGRRPSRAYHGAPRKPRTNRQYINPTRFIKAAKQTAAEPYQSKYNFNDFEIAQLIKHNVELRDWQTPTPIQDQTIPLALNGKDIVGIANTGTGKTLAYAIPIIDRLLNDTFSRALIVAPTRELALQIEQECRLIGKGSNLYGAMLIGGTPMSPQYRDLRFNPRVVVGTPGRIIDHIERGTLNITQFNIITLDEVDRMLDMGFIHDVSKIMEQLAKPRQSYFFSATVDARVEQLIRKFSDNPITISVKTGDTCDTIEQNIVEFHSKEDKLEKLHKLLLSESTQKTLVFDETQRSVERLNQTLLSRGFAVDAIHGGKSQGQRQRALDKFKNSQVNVLVATDVAARGLDVDDITHVINYALPQSYEDYVHRIGRAARAGRTGTALTFIEV